jgi:hypothetical protein
LLAAVAVVSSAACNSMLGIDEWQASGTATASSTSSGSGGGGQGGGGGEAGSGGAPSCTLSFTTNADVILAEEPRPCPSGTISYNDGVWATVSATGPPTRHVLLRFSLDTEASSMLSAGDQTPVSATLHLTRTFRCDNGCPNAKAGVVDVFVATSNWKEGNEEDDGAMWCYRDGALREEWDLPGALGPLDRGPLLGSASVDQSSVTVDIPLSFDASMAMWLATTPSDQLSLLLVPQAGLVLNFATHESTLDPPLLSIDKACP